MTRVSFSQALASPPLTQAAGGTHLNGGPPGFWLLGHTYCLQAETCLLGGHTPFILHSTPVRHRLRPESGAVGYCVPYPLRAGKLQIKLKSPGILTPFLLKVFIYIIQTPLLITRAPRKSKEDGFGKGRGGDDLGFSLSWNLVLLKTPWMASDLFPWPERGCPSLHIPL